MKKLLLLVFMFLFSSTAVYSQDTTKIFIQPEFAGDYTKFVFSFDNHNVNSVKRLILNIDDDDVTFASASVAGETSMRGWTAWIDTSDYKTLYFLGDDTFYAEETCGEFKFELTGNKSVGHLQWTTKDSLNNDLKNDSLRFAYASGDTCYAIWTAIGNVNVRSYVAVGDFISSGGFTWEFWLMLDPYWIEQKTGNGYNRILASVDIGTQGGANPECYIGFGHASMSKKEFVFSLDGTLQNTINYYPPGGWGSLGYVWKHYAITHNDNGQVDLYIDGVRVASKLFASAGNVPQVVGGIDFGSWYDHNNSMVKYSNLTSVDEIRFWHSARTLSEINETKNICLTENTVLPTGLYAYYPILLNDIFNPIAVPGDFIVDHSVLGTHTNELPTRALISTYACTELECCGGSEPCLCETDIGRNYQIPNVPVSITGWTPNLEDDCCWKVDLEVACDMNFVNRLWVDLPAAIAVSGVDAPINWTVDNNQPSSGFSLSFPDGYLPAGSHTLKLCFENPVNPTSFTGQVRLLDYYDDNNYTEVCQKDSFNIVCQSICDCDSVYITDIVEYISTDPDHKCCYDVTIHAECDNYDIATLLFDYDWNKSVGVGVISSSQTWSQYYGNLDNDDGYIAAGDHVFRVCLGTDMTDNSTSFLLRYLDSDSLDICPVDSLEFVCNTACTCDDVYIASIIEYPSNDPDHKCCYDIVLRADCRKDGIGILDFLDDPNDHLSFSLVSSPQTFTQNFNTYTNDEGYLEAGDHVFRVCLSRFSPNDYASFLLMYLDANANITCPPDTIDLECGCCYRTRFNPTENPGNPFPRANVDIANSNKKEVKVVVINSFKPTISGDLSSWIRYGMQVAYAKVIRPDGVIKELSSEIIQVQGNPGNINSVTGCGQNNPNSSLANYTLVSGSSEKLSGPKGSFADGCYGREV
jgi:concanavalin A-like lectin/glucanase superfamily protein